MASAAPTPEALYARLRELHPGFSEERLARELDLNTVKTLTELKRGIGPRWDTAIRLLEIAGWLRLDGADERARAHRTEALVERAESALAALRR